MPATHSTSTRNAATDAVVDRIDLGTTDPTGDLVLKQGTTVLAILNFQNPAFGSAVNGEAAANPISSATATNSGVVDAWEARDRDNNVVMSGQAGQTWPIVAVVSGAGGQFSISGNKTSEFPVGQDFRVVNSANNNGTYTVASVTYNSGTDRTIITVEPDETIPSATVDGKLHRGQCGLDNANIAVDQQVTVSSMKYTALRQ